MRLFSLTVWMLAFSPMTGLSQSFLSEKVEYLEVGVFVHSVGQPFKASNSFIGLNRWPGLMIGTSLPLNHEKRIGLSYKPSLTFYHQKNLHFGWHFNQRLGVAYPSKGRFTAEALPGLGYLHTFEDAPLYRSSSSKKEQKRDWGRPQMTVSLGLGVGWGIDRNNTTRVFLQQEMVLQWPFAQKGGVPFILHNRTHFGIRRIMQK